MTVAHEDLVVRSKRAEETSDITAEVQAAVERSGVREGICVVSVAHTTAAVFVNENADPEVQRDLLHALGSVIRDDMGFRHAEGNSPAHVKSILTGSSATVPVRDGRLALGRWQGIYFAEYDGPRERHATVTVIGEASL